MSKVFEDEFMEIQEGLISLCLEATEGKVDKVYVYCSIEKKTLMFNAFFGLNGEIKTLRQLGKKPPLSSNFLKIGTNDLKKFREIAEKYGTPVPTEIKMYYNVVTGKFDAQYKYEEICLADADICAEDIFMKWISEEKNRLLN